MMIIEKEKETPITFEEFKSGISSGKLGPLTKLKDHCLTNNEWITINNLKLFHRLSPEEHSQGAILEQEKERRKKQEAEKVKLSGLANVYIQEVSRLEKLLNENILKQIESECLTPEKSLGTSEFLIIPAFGNISDYRFIFKSEDIEIVRTEKPQEFYPLVLANDTPESMRLKAHDFVANIAQKRKFISIHKVPEKIQTWEKLTALFLIAKDEPPKGNIVVDDGTSYSNRLLSENHDYRARWENPDSYGKVKVLDLINSYISLINLSGIGEETHLNLYKL